MMEIGRQDEYRGVMEMIGSCSVVPEGPYLSYHLVSMEWFKSW